MGGDIIKTLLSTIKTDFPDKAIDIPEGLQLLKEMISETMEDINGKINTAFENRNFESMQKYTTLSEQIYNYENKLEEIIDFLDIDYDENKTLVNSSNTIRSTSKTTPNYEEYKVDQNVEHTLYENFTHIRPYGFKFLSDEVIQVKTWQEMFAKTCEILIEVDGQKFLDFENMPRMNGKKRRYFSKEIGNMVNPIKIKDKIYIETNMSSNGIRNMIVKMLKEYGYNVKDYKVYFLADYTNLNH